MLIKISVALSAAFKVMANSVALVISTSSLVRVRESPPSPRMLNMEASISLVVPDSLTKLVPVTVKTPVVAS